MRGRTVPPQTPRFPPVIQLSSHDKAGAHQEAQRFAEQGMTGTWIIQELHDDSCLAGNTHKDRDCICEPDFVLMRHDAHANFMSFDRSMRARQKAGCN